MGKLPDGYHETTGMTWALAVLFFMFVSAGVYLWRTDDPHWFTAFFCAFLTGVTAATGFYVQWYIKRRSQERHDG